MMNSKIQTTDWIFVGLNPKVDSPPFVATVAAAAPRQHYQVDPVTNLVV